MMHNLSFYSTDIAVLLTPEDPEGYPVPGDIVVYTVNTTNQGSLTLSDVMPQSLQVERHRKVWVLVYWYIFPYRV